METVYLTKTESCLLEKICWQRGFLQEKVYRAAALYEPPRDEPYVR